MNHGSCKRQEKQIKFLAQFFLEKKTAARTKNTELILYRPAHFHHLIN